MTGTELGGPLEWGIAILLVAGGLFGLVGSFGLLKLKDPMQRLHAPTKASTVGLAGALAASMLYFLGVKGELTWQELLITIFVLTTAPITANFLSKTHLHLTVRRTDLPATGTARDWATLESDRTEG
jgi:multicomponent K+:H+ antiporter subunit G